MAEHRRHDLVHADHAAWAALLAVRPDMAALPWVADWARAGWPLIVRRASAGDPPGQVALGLPLPPSAGKLRVFFALAPGAIGAAQPPPTLSAAADSAPQAWRETVDRVIGLQGDVRVFGALAWQALTGLPYLSATSDIDLLWRLPAADQVAPLLNAIGAIEADAPMALDGELVRDDGAAVNWRELASGADTVLVKQRERVSMQPRAAFLAGAA